MMLTFFVGSYTEFPIPGFGGIGQGIYTVQLNTDSGELSVIHVHKSRNPSYLSISEDNQFLYCCTEIDEVENPVVRAFNIKADGSLAFLNEQPVPGGFPCHIAKFHRSVIVACYTSGNVLQFPLDKEGKLKKATKNFYHSGSGINKSRQEAAHTHQIAVHPDSNEIYVCDLGIDKIKGYISINDCLVPNEEKDCSVTTGGGPRHMQFNFNGSMAYVVNELTGTVSILKNNKGIYNEVKTSNTLPSDFSGEFSCSAIRLHPNGKYLYVAIRKLEALAIFIIVADEILLLGHHYTKGEELREFNITPDGCWLIACHQNSHDTVTYRIQDNGSLQEKFRTKALLSPVCVAFFN